MQTAISVKEEICTKIKVPRNFCSSDLSLDCVHIYLYLYKIRRKNIYVYYVEIAHAFRHISMCTYMISNSLHF